MLGCVPVRAPFAGRRYMRHQVYFLIVLTGTCVAQSPADIPWTTTAHWHRFLKTTLPGTLVIDTGGVEFRSPKFTGHWPNIEIQTFELSSHELTLTTY